MDKNVVYRRISFTDLIECDIPVTAVKREGTDFFDYHGDKDKIHKALYTLGIKTNHRLEVLDVSEHIRHNGKRTVDYSFVGEERSDKQWLSSPYASEEAKIASCKMKDMVNIASQLGRGGIR